jgi:hypothetical protein
LGRLRLHLGSPNVTPLVGLWLLFFCLFQAACATHPLKVAMTISTDANNNSPVLLSVVHSEEPNAV